MKVNFSIGCSSVDLPDEVTTLTSTFQSVMMDSRELLYLAAVLWSYGWRSDCILVEIGAFHGQTTVFMAKVLELLGRRLPILSIDPFERAVPDPLNPQGNYAAFMGNVLAHRYGHQCMPLAAFSHDAAPVVPSRIGVLVVDGGHHYPIVSGDLRLYAPKVRPGGYMFIDDYGGAYPDVMQAVDEYLTADSPFEVVHREYFLIAKRRGSVGWKSEPESA
jgi:cephalosporin hydroxylase